MSFHQTRASPTYSPGVSATATRYVAGSYEVRGRVVRAVPERRLAEVRRLRPPPAVGSGNVLPKGVVEAHEARLVGVRRAEEHDSVRTPNRTELRDCRVGWNGVDRLPPMDSEVDAVEQALGSLVAFLDSCEQVARDVSRDRLDEWLESVVVAVAEEEEAASIGAEERPNLPNGFLTAVGDPRL